LQAKLQLGFITHIIGWIRTAFNHWISKDKDLIFIKLLSMMHFSLLYQDMGSGLDAEELVDVESQPTLKKVNKHFHLCTGLWGMLKCCCFDYQNV